MYFVSISTQHLHYVSTYVHRCRYVHVGIVLDRAYHVSQLPSHGMTDDDGFREVRYSSRRALPRELRRHYTYVVPCR